jgi:predicted O-linked N-acetylglucosamine transferase (SPINDLY family)
VTSELQPELRRLGALATTGRYRELEQSSRDLLRQWPDSGPLYKLLAIALWMQKKDALDALERATTLLPHDAEVHSDLGTALLALGRPEDAVAWYRRALQIRPDFVAAHHNLGIALARGGNITAAAASYRRALELQPTFVAALTGLAEVLQQCGEHQQAVACYRRALALRPEQAPAHHGLGQALQSLGDGGGAESSYRQAIVLQPSYFEAHLSLGKLLRLAHRTAESFNCLQRALTLRADDPAAVCAHAELLYSSGDYRGAVAGFRRALQVDPAYDAARIGAVVAEIAPIPMTPAEATASCAAYGTALSELASGLEQQPCANPAALVGALRPFLLAYREPDDCELMRTYGRLCARLMGQWQRDVGIVAASAVRAADSKLRIGLVSEYFRNHSVYNAITHGWLHRLDRKRFTVEVYCLDARADARTNAARGMADHFEQGDRTLREWARVIVDRRPDVLIYPEVGMNPTTLQLASMRLARTQMVSWGHPVTSGLPTIDYYLSAAAFESEASASQYTERLVRLPNLGVYYEPPERTVATRHNLTRGAQGPVLVCAGTPFKYSPEHDQVLIGIARRLRRCQFHFFSYEDGALSRRLLQRLHAAFAAAGLDGSQFLVLRPLLPSQQFNDFLGSADLLLDSIGFSGFNTIMHALACDLPVVTVRGRSLRGRLGSGILERLSLPQLVAESPGSYEDIAVSLLENRSELAATRARIRAQLPTSYQDQSAIAALEEFLLSVG